MPGIPSVEVVGVVIGAGLTLAIFSYVLGDNPLYRAALHLFVGALVGYSFGILFRDVLVGMVWNHLQDNPMAVIVPLVLGILLLFKGFPKQAYVGNLSVAFLIGVGTAVALGGALLGTLVPQIGATSRALSSVSLDGLLIFVGTACTLMAFYFTARSGPGLAGVWSRLVGIGGGIGRVFLIFAFGIAFAGALTASLSVFIGRIAYLIDAYWKILAGG